MIKFSQERLRKSISKTAKGLGHTLETWESHVSALQNGKQGCPCSLLYPWCKWKLLLSVILSVFHKKSSGSCFQPGAKRTEVLAMFYGEKNSGCILPLRTHITEAIGLTSV